MLLLQSGIHTDDDDDEPTAGRFIDTAITD